MSIFSLILLLFAAMLVASILGATFEALIGLLTRLIPESTRIAIAIQLDAYESMGKRDRFIFSRYAPGIGHLISYGSIAKDITMFAGLGMMNAFIITRFLGGGDRAEWFWYLVPLLFTTPVMPMKAANQVPAWLRLTGIAAYAASCLMFGAMPTR